MPAGEIARTDRDYFRHEKRCLGNELSGLAEELSDHARGLEESAKENSLAEAQSPLLNMAKALRDTSAVIAEGRRQFRTVRYTTTQMVAA